MSAGGHIKVLVVGSGTLGSSVLFGLAANKAYHVTLLVRQASLDDATKKEKFDKLRAAGVHFLHGDASEDVSALVPKLTGFHTVVSVLSWQSLKENETNLLNAAKQAHVKRFVPSSFGFDPHTIGRGSPIHLLDDKLDVEDLVRASGLDYVFIYTGVFTEYLFSPFFGVDVAKSTVTAQVSFDTSIPHTSLADIGNLVAAALLDPAVTKTSIRLTSETVTYEQIVQALEHAGKKIDRKITPKGGNRVNFDNPDFFTSLGARFLDLVSGPGATWDAALAWNKKALPNHHTVTIAEYAKKLAA